MRIVGSGSGSVHWHLHVTLRFRDARSKRRAVASRAKRKHAGARATLGARPVLRARRELRLAWTGRAERLLFRLRRCSSRAARRASLEKLQTPRLPPRAGRRILIPSHPVFIFDSVSSRAPRSFTGGILPASDLFTRNHLLTRDHRPLLVSHRRLNQEGQQRLIIGLAGFGRRPAGLAGPGAELSCVPVVLISSDTTLSQAAGL